MKRNFWDRVIEQVDPQRALKRIQARAVLEVVNKRYDKLIKSEQRKFDGAAKGRHYSDWRSPNLSINQEIMRDLATLRERSRDLGRNNAYAINAVRTLRNNVIGTGILPVPNGGGKNQLKQVKKAWAEWAGKTTCDYDDMSTLYGLQSLILKTVVESGEALVRKVRGDSKDPFPIRLQVLEGDYLDGSHHTGTWSKDGWIEFYGIRFDKKGRRLGYWIFKQHPSEYGGESEFVPADSMIHVYEVERPGQIRGIPFSCGVMLRLKDLEDYEFTERIRNKVAASFAVFITDPSGSDSPSAGEGDDLERVEPAMIKHLSPGQDVKVAQPPTSQGFGEFVKSTLRGIAAGFGASYESVTNDYSNVNFSSGRMGWIESNKNAEHLQWNMMIPRFCDKVFVWFIEGCKLAGVIPFSAAISTTWTPPRREMIDPYKEIQAIREAIRAGIYSWQEAIRMYGYVSEDLQREFKEDAEMWDRLNLKPTSDPRFDPNRQIEGASPPPDEDDNENEAS